MVNQDTEITLTCGKCGAEFKKTIRWLKANDHVACPACGHTVATDEFSEKLSAFEKKWEETVRRIQDTFKRRR